MILGLVICVIILAIWCWHLDKMVNIHEGNKIILKNELKDFHDLKYEFENFKFQDEREKEALANSILDLRLFVGFDPSENGYKNFEEGGRMKKLEEK